MRSPLSSSTLLHAIPSAPPHHTVPHTPRSSVPFSKHTPGPRCLVVNVSILQRAIQMGI